MECRRLFLLSRRVILRRFHNNCTEIVRVSSLKPTGSRRRSTKANIANIKTPFNIPKLGDATAIMECGVAKQNLIKKLPVITRLDSPEYKNLFTDGLKYVMKLFKAENHELRICGGAVRDLILGKAPHDLDLATTATPDEMINMFRKNDIRLICENGWSHGTVTCRVEEENFEITTLRIDKVTDGRRAIVEYTKDWFQDASRRDLTCNSLFLTLDGDVIDYFNGVSDIKNRQVRFVGDPALRIQEDYLRILRYFRFFGRLKEENAQPDEDTLAHITKYADGLSMVAGERKWVEFVMILNGKLVVPIMRMMYRCGLYKYLGLPENVDLNYFEQIYKKTKHLSPNHMTFLASILKTKEDLDHLAKTVKFSKFEYNVALFIVENRTIHTPDIDMIPVYIDLIVECLKRDKNMITVFMELLKYTGHVDIIDYFTHYKVPVFPLKGGIVKEHCGLKGKSIGQAMEFAQLKWKDSRYTLSSQDLIAIIEENKSNFVKI